MGHVDQDAQHQAAFRHQTHLNELHALACAHGRNEIFKRFEFDLGLQHAANSTIASPGWWRPVKRPPPKTDSPARQRKTEEKQPRTKKGGTLMGPPVGIP